MASSICPEAADGARNLLRGCIGARPGETLLLIDEAPEHGYYDEHVANAIGAEARAQALRVRRLRAPLAPGPDQMPAAVAAALRADDVDHAVFCARLGDQIRFRATHGRCSKTMCYALDLGYLSSDFARTPWALYRQVHDRLLAAMLSAERYRLSCPLGTDLRGRVPRERARRISPFTVNAFPVMICPPLACAELSGQLVLDRFLLSTSLNAFADSVLPLARPLLARIEQSRIVGFDGDADLAAAAERHYRRVGAFSGGDPFAVNSWHAGIYPKTFYTADPLVNVQRWGDMAFASPRYTHFHTCGDAPGNIATATFDATIAFDGEVFWDRGRLAFLDRADVRALLDDYPDAPGAFDMRWDIGI